MQQKNQTATSAPVSNVSEPGSHLNAVLLNFAYAAITCAALSAASVGAWVIFRFGLEWLEIWVGSIILVTSLAAATEPLLLLLARSFGAYGVVRLAWHKATMKAEKLMNRDLDGDSNIGEAPAPVVVNKVRLVPTNFPAKSHVFEVGETKVSHDDFVEFVLRASQAPDGLVRENWVKDPPYIFESGERCSREIYDAIISILMGRLRCVSGSKNKGGHRTLTRSPQEIFDMAGVQTSTQGE